MTSDLTRLAADLDTAAQRIDDKVAPIVKKGATDIADAARGSLTGGSQHTPSARDYAYRNLGYDTPSRSQLSIEIGYSSLMSDPLALSFEFGSANTAPGDHVGAALRAEIGDFAANIARVGARPWP